MEATGFFRKPVCHISNDSRIELILANDAYLKNVPGRKTDVGDAARIAELLACGLIRSSFVPARQIQDLRDLIRTRKQRSRDARPKVSKLCLGVARRLRLSGAG